MSEHAAKDAPQCFSCERPARHRSPNGRVHLCDWHVRSLPGTDAYASVTPPAKGGDGT